MNPRVAVIVATAGRRPVIERMLPFLTGQDYEPIDYFVVAPDAESLPRDTTGYSGLTTLLSDRGLTKQRNVGLRALDVRHEYVFFFDDDAIPDRTYIGKCVALFESESDIVGVTGNVVIDGAALDREISIDEALSKLEEASTNPLPGIDPRNKDLYGCNFGARASVAVSELFDERLPLYGWLEDQDFSRRVLRHGKIATVGSALVAHLAAQSGGRTDHVRFGYWQVSNPVHLLQKKSFGVALTLRQIGRPLLANVLGSVNPRGVDRRLRLKGNAIAVLDLIRGQCDPDRALKLRPGSS